MVTTSGMTDDEANPSCQQRLGGIRTCKGYRLGGGVYPNLGY
jgi:hypothetical protein